MKRMTVKEFREIGYLQELNRQFLHPLGLALEVVVDDDGNESFGHIWDSRDDPEGIIYEKVDRKKRQNVSIEQATRFKLRHEGLGYIIQPRETELLSTKMHCGHPRSSIVSSNEGTNYCKDCEGSGLKGVAIYKNRRQVTSEPTVRFISGLVQSLGEMTNTDAEDVLSGLWRELWNMEELLADTALEKADLCIDCGEADTTIATSP